MFSNLIVAVLSCSAVSYATLLNTTTTDASGGASSNPVYHADAGLYQPTGQAGSCGVVITNSDLAGAVSSPSCGEKIQVNGPKGSVQVLILDECASCGSTRIDLTQGAFEQIGDPSAGIIPVTFSQVD